MLFNACGRYEILMLKVIHRRRRTGFEETKDFPIRVSDLIAGRYQVRMPRAAAWLKLGFHTGFSPWGAAVVGTWKRARCCEQRLTSQCLLRGAPDLLHCYAVMAYCRQLPGQVRRDLLALGMRCVWQYAHLSASYQIINTTVVHHIVCSIWAKNRYSTHTWMDIKHLSSDQVWCGR